MSEDFVAAIAFLYSEGKTDDEVAEIVRVSRRTLSAWRKRHPDFLLTSEDAKAFVDDTVELSLLDRAKGIVYTDTKEEILHGEKVTLVSVKHIAPDTRAAEFWLRNRRPDHWRDKTEMDINNPDGKMRPLFQVYIPDNGRDKPDDG